MSDQDIPILEGRPPNAAELRLVALFDELEKQQVDFLDQAGKRIIELVTLLQGVFLAVIAFGKEFPPPYLVGQPAITGLAILAVVLYLAALLLALYAVNPRPYRRYDYNLTALREQLDAMLTSKARWVKVAGIVFGLASIVLGLLVGILIWQAATPIVP